MIRASLPGLSRFTTVRSRLTLWNVVVLTIALIAVSIQIRYSVRANIMSSIDRELSSMSRYASRMAPRRGRGRIPGSGAANSSTFSGTVRQLDAQIGITAPVGAPGAFMQATISPGVPPSQQYNIGSPNGAGDSRPGTPPLSPPGFPRRMDVIPNSPATRLFVNGPHTYLNEPPWDLNAYWRSVNENYDVYETVNPGLRSARLYTHTIRTFGGTSVVTQSTFPLTEMDRAEHSLDITLLTTIPLVLFIAGLGGAFLTNRALRPVRQITRTAELIGAQDLSRRLPVGTDDEFSHLAATFNAMLARLETSFNQQRRFTADASHELKSPLTVIKANASLALRSPRSPEEYVRRVEAIDKATNHMRLLVEDLLILARADEGQLSSCKEPLSLNSLLAEAVETTHRPDAAAVTLDLPREHLMVEGDRHELMRVFTNLIENALRYTPPSGSISVSGHDETVAVSVTVADTGEGIAEEHVPHLGERFYRVEASRARTHGGSGLGLAICKSVVEAHHGSITFRSQKNTGTTVVVTLPAASKVIV